MQLDPVLAPVGSGLRSVFLDPAAIFQRADSECPIMAESSSAGTTFGPGLHVFPSKREQWSGRFPG